MKQPKGRAAVAAGAAMGLSLLLSGAAQAEDIFFDQEQGKGELVTVLVRNGAGVTVDSVVIKQHGHGGCAAASKRHKQNLAGSAGKAKLGDGFNAFLWSGCDYEIKFSTVTACSKGDKDITIRASEDKTNMVVQLQGNCLTGVKTKASIQDPNSGSESESALPPM